MAAKHLARLLLFVLVTVVSTATAQAADTTVDMLSSNEFSPENVTVQVGDTVTWVNRDVAVHDAAALDPTVSWQTGYVDPNEQAAQTFAKAGTFPYECRIHPGMTGRITVLPAMPPTDAPGTAEASEPTDARPAILLAVLLVLIAVVRRAGGSVSRSRR